MTSLFLFSAMLHGYAGLRLLPALIDRPIFEIPVALALTVSAFPLPLALIGRRLATSPGRRAGDGLALVAVRLHAAARQRVTADRADTLAVA